MRKEVIFSYETPFSGEHNIYGYIYGGGTEDKPNPRADKSAAIVGAMRGNEYQQLYICSLLSKKLAELEEDGDIVQGKSILIIPSVNYSALNAGHKFWLSDDSDINREFPGNPDGPATSRLAYSLLEMLKEYTYGIQLPSFYMQGKFIPHVRMMKTGHESTNLANLFGLPFVLMNDMRSFDEGTLNYNWQLAGTEAFSIYSGGTDRIEEKFADRAVYAILRFLSRMGIIKYNSMGGNISTTMDEEDMINIKSGDAGFFRDKVGVNTEVHRGEVLAEIVDPMDGHVKSQVFAPTDGIIFFAQDQPLVYENVVIYKMIRKLHK